ncbi:sulfite exporter TauE/SafE family protein [Halovivax cerinus]|uniref:sulfite exporter TauE/SafE family protein n=1 Tax=Halovivax cerinus TaxID=1487865 RepID=UPI00211594B3|nr:sulfite exporter TauE/SafE family protein [Halovivax cerinus]
MTAFSSVVAAAGHDSMDVAANADLVAFLVVGLLAGAHCLGMCGPLVTTYGQRMSSGSERRADDLSLFEVRQHLLFNLGRTASYALIGGLVALLGALAFASADATFAVGNTLRATTGILVGLLIIASGLYYLRGRAGVPGHGLPVVGSVFAAVSGALTSHVDRLANGPGIVLLGGLHGLLPCPIIYPAYLYAFAQGEPVRGALSLAVLGLGTIPTLFVYGTLVTAIGSNTRVHLHRALGVAFVVLGYFPLKMGLMVFGVDLPGPSLPFYQGL